MADNERLLHAAQRLAGQDAETADVDLIHEAHPADLAHVLHHLEPPERNALFRSLGRDQAGEVLSSCWRAGSSTRSIGRSPRSSCSRPSYRSSRPSRATRVCSR